jgi:hypothetical protein
LAVGDFNGDSRPDLATNQVIMLGNGDGTFQAAHNTGAGSSVVGDFNGDGRLDLVTVDYDWNGGAGTVSVLLGNGDGTFQAARKSPTGPYPWSVAVGDFDGDSRLDLVTGGYDNNGGAGTVSVLLGNGDGTFQAARNFPAEKGSESVAVSDVNGDGRLDAVVANHFQLPSSSVSVLRNDGHWIDEPTVTLSAAPLAIAEARGSATVTATLSAVSNLPTTIDLGFSGTASNLTDYSPSHTSITIPVGSTTGTITLTAVQDTLIEGDETIVVSINWVTYGTPGGSPATVTITDDDPLPTVTLSAAPLTIPEGGTATVTATLSAVSCLDTIISFGFSGTASQPSDYGNDSPLWIMAGSTTGTLGLYTHEDTLVEGDETIVVSISSVTNGTAGGSPVTLTIIDDDPASTTTTLASKPNPSVYGQMVTFTATVTSGVGTPTGTVTFKDGKTTLGTGPLNAGIATFTTSSLSVGRHTITAAYPGTDYYKSSTSAKLTQTVNQASTKTMLASSATSSPVSPAMTFSEPVVVAMAPGGDTPTGPVTFKDGTTISGRQHVRFLRPTGFHYPIAAIGHLFDRSGLQRRTPPDKASTLAKLTWKVDA